MSTLQNHMTTSLKPLSQGRLRPPEFLDLGMFEYDFADIKDQWVEVHFILWVYKSLSYSLQVRS